MKIKILIKTPKGKAKSAQETLKKFIIVKGATVDAMYVNQIDNEICWEISGDPRRLNKTIKNAAMYDVLIKSILDNKIAKKAINKALDIEGQKELQDMLLNQTSVEVVTEATAEELAMKDDSVFNKLKRIFFKDS